MSEKNESVNALPEMAANDTNAVSPKMSQREQAAKTVKRYAAASAGLGIIPIPALDMAAIGTSQLLMIRSVSKMTSICPRIAFVQSSVRQSVERFRLLWGAD
jgi:hypothetical protein